jgi:hypothetical protein
MVLGLLLPTFQSQSQSISGEPSASEIEDYVKMLERMPAVDRSGPSVYNIPVCFHLVKGTTQGKFSIFSPNTVLNKINAYFNSNTYNCPTPVVFNFYACSVDFTISDDLVLFDPVTEWQALYDGTPHCEESINVYDVGAIYNPVNASAYQAISRLPSAPSPNNMIVMKDVDELTTQTQLLAHEIGRYFGLLETYSNPPQFGVYPSTITFANGFQQTFTASGSGDFVYDTEGDPGYNFQTQQYYCDGGCINPLPCTVNDLLGVAYNPNRDNLMSHFSCDTKRLTCGQFERMASFLNDPSRSFLIDNNPPTCQTLVDVKPIVDRNCTSIGSYGVEGIFNLDIKVEKTDGLTSTNCIRKTDGDGLYVVNQTTCDLVWTPTSNITLIPDPSYQLNSPNTGLPYPPGSGAALNGVTGADMLRISKHILNITPFSNPYQFIAGDVNNSGSVTTFDIVKIRRVILGIDENFSPVGNWRYVPKYCFEDPSFVTTFNSTNPFLSVWNSPSGQRNYSGNNSFMDRVNFNISSPNNINSNIWAFNGMKTGDVTCDAYPEQIIEPGSGLIVEGVPHLPTIPTKNYILKVIAKGESKIAAYQFGFDFAQDSLQVIEAQAGTISNFSTDNFGMTHLTDGELRTVWYQPNGTSTDVNGKTLFQIKIKATKNIANIADRFVAKKSILPAKFYDTNGNEIKTISLKLELVSAIGLDEPNIADRNQVINEEVKPIVIPNPSRGEANIQFILPNPNKVQLILFDQMGRMLRLQEDTFSDGEITWPIQDFSDLPTGVYAYALIYGEHKVFGKIAKI